MQRLSAEKLQKHEKAGGFFVYSELILIFAAEMLHNLSTLAGDENMLKRVAK